VLEDEAQDEFKEYFDGRPPKMAITTSKRPSRVVCEFAQELVDVFPNSEFHKRHNFDIKTIVKEANERGYTDLMIINEDRKEPNAMTLIHLPNGPTAVFRLRSVKFSNELYVRGRILL
jgi:ribosome production factor 1